MSESHHFLAGSTCPLTVGTPVHESWKSPSKEYDIEHTLFGWVPNTGKPSTRPWISGAVCQFRKPLPEYSNPKKIKKENPINPQILPHWTSSASFLEVTIVYYVYIYILYIYIVYIYILYIYYIYTIYIYYIYTIYILYIYILYIYILYIYTIYIYILYIYTIYIYYIYILYIYTIYILYIYTIYIYTIYILYMYILSLFCRCCSSDKSIHHN